ncbi:MAG: hypothetical protein ABIO55_16365 [Ginsengibacter sp.]
MKKAILAYALASICTVFTTGSALCQLTSDFESLRLGNAEVQGPTDIRKINITTERDYMNTIDIKVVRKFLRDFQSGKNIVWTERSNGIYVAQFFIDSVKTIIAYNKNGSWKYMLKTYGESKMRSDLKNRIKNSFPDYSIVEVREIESPGSDNIICSVQIKDGKNIKILKIQNNEMETEAECTEP